ncbi:MAG TPA: hypothetical protein VKP13_11160 [Nitrospira sp.]|nr:hypothetical protein [Nitrospira sp.]
MHLVVYIPHRTDEESSLALSLARQAPSFTVEWANDHKMVIAAFPSLPEEIEAAVRLVGEAVRLAGAWASMNSKPVSSLTKLWQRLACYRDSLECEDPVRYCREKSALFHTLVGCEQHLCPVPCQFICTPCMRVEQEGMLVMPGNRYSLAAELGEVDWCPRLNLSSGGEASGLVPLLPSRPPKS